jgi:NADH-quinone oxidoreductase subunit E
VSDSRNQEIGDSRNQEIRRQGFEKSLPVLNADVPASLGAAGAAPGVRHELGPDEKALKREKIVEVLWGMQQRHGWISDESVKIAAVECALSPEEVDEIATFYNLLFRSPANKIKLFVCDSISCHLTGADALMGEISKQLGIPPGGNTPDGVFTLVPIVCLGHCEKAPCVLAGENVYGPLRPDAASVRELLQRIKDDRGPAQG